MWQYDLQTMKLQWNNEITANIVTFTAVLFMYWIGLRNQVIFFFLLCFCFLLFTYFIYSGMYMLIPASWFIPPLAPFPLW